MMWFERPGFRMGVRRLLRAAQAMINHQKLKRLREKFAATNNMSISAMEAGVDRKTARKYLQTDQSPQELASHVANSGGSAGSDLAPGRDERIHLVPFFRFLPLESRPVPHHRQGRGCVLTIKNPTDDD